MSDPSNPFDPSDPSDPFDASARPSGIDPTLLARRAADAVASIARRAGRLISWWLAIAAFVAIGSFWAGMVVLDGGVRTVWFVIGLVFIWTSVVGLVRLRWSIGTIRRNADHLVDEVGRLVQQDASAERLVVDAVEVDEPATGRTMMVFSQQFSGIGGSLGTDRSSYRWTDRVVATMRTGFLTLAKSVVITGIFAVLGLVFLIALAI